MTIDKFEILVFSLEAVLSNTCFDLTACSMRTTEKAIFVALSILLLFTEINSFFWRRRRRRKSQPPRPPVDPCAGSRDCSVSSWSGWSSCSLPCGFWGVKRRSRYITSSAVNCGTCNYNLHDTEACNREAWRCLHGSFRAFRGCTCRPGWTNTCCGTGKSARCD